MEDFVVNDRRRLNGGVNGHEELNLALSEMPMDMRSLESSIRKQIRSLETSELLARYQFARQNGITFGGARDEYEILGYDRVVTTKQYRDEYARGGIAGRIVDAMPNATWRGEFELIEDEDPKNYTDFEKAWEDLDRRLQIQAKLCRVDKLAGLSTYAVLLIGAPGDLSQELPKGKPEQLLYLTPFSGGGGPSGVFQQRAVGADADASIYEFEIDPESPRFGLPTSYRLRRVDITSPNFARPVHWTRVIHIAENLLDDEVYGQPALERVWNLLCDLRKVTGGGAEAFWLRANQGMHLDIDKDMSLNDTATKTALEKLKEDSEAYKHQLTRWLRTRGVTAKVLGSDVANFENPADAILTQIAGAKAMPKRILMGSEMGELASSQDRDNWKDQINGRQNGYAAPYIVRPLVNRLIQYGYLPTPKKGVEAYEVRWPHIQTLTAQEKVEGAKGWATVNQSYGSVVFTDAEIRDKWESMPPLTDEQRQEIADRNAEKLKQQQEAMAAAAPPEKKQNPFAKRAAQEFEPEDELVGILRDAMAVGATDVVLAITGLGGPGSGNYGHAGRPGEVGGSGSSHSTREKVAGVLGVVAGFDAYEHGDVPERPHLHSPSPHERMRERRTPAAVVRKQTSDDYSYKVGDPAAMGKAKRAIDDVRRDITQEDPTSISAQVNHTLDNGSPTGYELHVRHFGEWFNPSDAADEEDYDFQVPTKATVNKLNEIANRVAKNHPDVHVRWVDQGEKNYVTFFVTPKIKALGGPGSGNFGHAGRPGEVGGSTTSGHAEAAQRFNDLKAEWSRLNDQLFRHIDNPTSPEARALINKQKEVIKQTHTLEADPGGIEGIGLPGGPRDVVIVGAGPGGYSAAVMGGAEGLDTLLVEATPRGGGQAKYSSRVENLPGFPAGVTGEKLATDMHDQAERMGAELKYGVSATGIEYDPVSDLKTVTLSDGSKIETRSVIIAGGVQFKRGEFEGADDPSVSYGDSRQLARMGAGKPVVVAGGSNGAAQAALLAAQASEHVSLISRKPIDASMSSYQVHALRNHPKITVLEGEEISKIANGVATLKSGKEIPAGATGVFFGGRPQTDWLPKEIKREKNGKIITNAGMETDIPGVFAVGDVRYGSIGRIGMAIGDGQFATHAAFQYYERMKRIGKAFEKK